MSQDRPSAWGYFSYFLLFFKFSFSTITFMLFTNRELLPLSQLLLCLLFPVGISCGDCKTSSKTKADQGNNVLFFFFFFSPLLVEIYYEHWLETIQQNLRDEHKKESFPQRNAGVFLFLGVTICQF